MTNLQNIISNVRDQAKSLAPFSKEYREQVAQAEECLKALKGQRTEEKRVSALRELARVRSDLSAFICEILEWNLAGEDDSDDRDYYAW